MLDVDDNVLHPPPVVPAKKCSTINPLPDIVEEEEDYAEPTKPIPKGVDTATAKLLKMTEAISKA